MSQRCPASAKALVPALDNEDDDSVNALAATLEIVELAAAAAAPAEAALNEHENLRFAVEVVVVVVVAAAVVVADAATVAATVVATAVATAVALAAKLAATAAELAIGGEVGVGFGKSLALGVAAVAILLKDRYDNNLDSFAAVAVRVFAAAVATARVKGLFDEHGERLPGVPAVVIEDLVTVLLVEVRVGHGIGLSLGDSSRLGIGLGHRRSQDRGHEGRGNEKSLVEHLCDGELRGSELKVIRK